MSEYAKNIQKIEDLWKKRIGLRSAGDCMSEYIITCDDEVAMWVGNDVETMKRIVRCRDCKYYNECWDFCERLKPGMVVEPDGFCAWGERREP